MDNIFKGIVGVIIMIFISFIGIIVITSSASARAADDYMQSCVQKIESSNYAAPVIDACKDDAANKGYEFEVETYQNPTTNQTTYGTATITYTYKIPFVTMQKDRTIEMDLR